MNRNQRPRPVGSICGYQIMVEPSEFSDISRPNPWKVPGGVLKTDDLEAVFRARTAFSLDSMVTTVARINALRVKSPDRFQSTIERDGYSAATTFMPFLMRRVLTKAIADRALPDAETEEVSPGWLLAAERVLFDITAGQDESAKAGDADASSSLIMRVLQAQFHDQLSHFDYMRELRITNRAVELAEAEGLNLESRYLDRYGLRWTEMATLCFVIFATVVQGKTGVLDPGNINVQGVLNMRESTIQAFFRMCGTDYAGIRGTAADPDVLEEGYETYAMSPLIFWPLVKRSDGLFVAPFAKNLLERATHSFHFDTREILSGSERGTLNRAVGGAYEEYVERSLGGSPGVGQLRRGVEILPTRGRNCDFIAIEDWCATLIEAKSVRTALVADMTKDKAVLVEEFGKKGGLADALVQLNESAVAVREGRVPNLGKRTILNGLIIARGEQVMMNHPFASGILKRLAEERGGRRIIIKYHVANDVDLDSLARLCHSGESLGKFLYRKRKDKIIDSEDIHHTVVRVRKTQGDHPLQDEVHGFVRDLVRTYAPGWRPESSSD